MNMLIIGNGFDLAHGLPTRYTDFLTFVRIFMEFEGNNKFSPLNEIEERMVSFLSNLHKQSDNKDVTADAILSELKELTEDNVWIEYFQTIHTKDGWIDFEKTISKVIQALDSFRYILIEQTRQGVSHVKMPPGEYSVLQPIVDKENHGYKAMSFEMKAISYRKHQLLKDLNRLTRCLEIYLSEFIAEFPIENKLHDIANLEVDAVLSFNYTDTYKSVYNADGSKQVEYDFVHGKANIENDVNSCNMVIGIDEYLYGESKNMDNEFVEFKKFYQRIYKGTGSDYYEWLSASDIKLYFYGHSLDITDKDILKHLITSKKTETTIFYHTKDALRDQIINLVKVIGEDELIIRTGGAHPSIVFQETTNIEV